MKSWVVASTHLCGNAWEKAHELQERAKFSAGWAVTARCCSHQMAFLPFSWRGAGPNRDTFIPKYCLFVAPLLHSLKPFHHAAWCLSTTCLCCTTFSCQMHSWAKQLCEDQLRSLEWSWQYTLELHGWFGCYSERQDKVLEFFVGFFSFFFKGCSSICGSAPWSPDTSPCMSVFL